MDVRLNSIDSETRCNWSWPHLIIVFLAAVVVFSNTLAMDFVFDDIPLIKGPSPLKSLANIPGMFTTGVSSGTNFGGAPPYYRPIFNVSLAIDYFFWRENPFGYHLTNVLLHGLVSMLVYLLACSILKSRLSGVFAGLIFAIHPTHSEAVAYVAARNELLCALFMTSALLAYLWYRRDGRTLFLVLSLSLFFLSLLSKEMSVTLPVLLFLYEMGVRKSPLKKRFAATIPFFAVISLYLLIRVAVLTNTTWDSPPLPVRVNTAIVIVVTYLRLLFVPVNLKVFYDIPIRWEFLQTAVIVSLAFLVLFAGLTLYSRRIRGPLFLSLGWMLISFLPASGLPMFIAPALMAERYLYIPSIGFALCTGVLFGMLLDQPAAGEDARGRIPGIHRLGMLSGCVLLILLAALAYSNNFNWRDQPTLYGRMIADAPGHPLGYYNLGNYYGNSKQYSKMAGMYQKSLALVTERQYEMAANYIRRGNLDRAEHALRLLEGNKVSDAGIYNNLGVVCLQQGKPVEAVTLFRKAVALERENPEFQQNLEAALRTASPGNP